MATYLHYRYPGEEWTRVATQNGQEIYYEIAQTRLQHVRVYYKRTYRRCIAWGATELVDTTNPVDSIILYGEVSDLILGVIPPGHTSSGKTGFYFTHQDPKTFAPAITVISSGNGFVDKCPSPSSGGFWLAGSANYTTFSKEVSAPPRYTIYVKYLDPRSGSLDTFYDDYGSAPPEVVLGDVPEEDTCPPETCAVTCGNTICCYNSQGISVFNYLK